MSPSKEKIELMYERFPTCPLCKSDKGYQFSGWIDDYVQCRSCGARWFLHDWLKDKPTMALMEAPRDFQTAAKCEFLVSYPLMSYPVDSWKDIDKLRESIPKQPQAHETIVQQTENYREAIKKLALLFAKGEISEETYRISVQDIEKKLNDLKQIEKKPSETTVKPLLCPQCGATISLEENKCRYCGVNYVVEKGNIVIKIK